jgi:simple sugar transport system permease protein
MARPERSARLLVGALGLAITVGISFLIVIVLVLFLSRDPGKTIHYFFLGPFTNRYYFGNMLNAAVPLAFTGLGMALAFQSSVFNLGGEGQVYASGLLATVICLALPQTNGYLGGALALLAALAGGGLLAGLSGLLRMKWGTDELISSFLLSSALVLVVNYFITGPLDDPTNNLLATRAIGGQFRLLAIYPPSKLNVSAGFALLAAAGVFFFLYYTHRGYEMRMCGLNREFSRYGGLDVSTYLVLPMVASGALHGLAGGVAVLGTHYMSLREFTFGMGWNGIAVALIARNHPLGVVPAAVFFAYLEAGAKAAMLHSDVTFEIAAIVQAVIFFLVTAQALYGLLRRRRRVAA